MQNISDGSLNLAKLSFLSFPLAMSGTLNTICALKNLEVVNLASNTFTGNIPCKLGSLGNLRQLFLSDNELTGDGSVSGGYDQLYV